MTSTITRRETLLGASWLGASAICGSAALAQSFDRPAIAQRLAHEGQLLVYWPAGANFKRWLQDTLVSGFEKHVKTVYGVDLAIALLSTGGGDAAFWQKYEAHQQAGDGSFPIDVVRVAPDVRTLDAIDAGAFAPLLPQNAALLPNVAKLNEPGRATFSRNGTLYAAPAFEPTISLFYNGDKVASPPRTLEDLAAWAKKNPRRFTYEDPRSSSGIGSGIMFLLAVMHRFGKADAPDSFAPGWAYLKELQSDVHPQPNTGEQALELMRRGEIEMMAFWNDWGLVARDTLGLAFMRNTLILSGVPMRNTPIAIPAKAQHPTAALVFVDWAASPLIQASLGREQRQIPASVAPETWADLPENAFGFPDEDIRAYTFPAFNSRQSVDAVVVLAEGWSRNVLGR
jgi:ABC-type uncharacterized transport system YnjBCD substrate-binding protein